MTADLSYIAHFTSRFTHHTGGVSLVKHTHITHVHTFYAFVAQIKCGLNVVHLFYLSFLKIMSLLRDHLINDPVILHEKEYSLNSISNFEHGHSCACCIMYDVVIMLCDVLCGISPSRTRRYRVLISCVMCNV